jgi:hypothetical protein
MAHLTTNSRLQNYSEAADEAKAAGTGLWGSCPDFGA